LDLYFVKLGRVEKILDSGHL